MKFRSLNESILSVTNPQPELTQNEYIELLEFALISIAEELECDVDDLVEDMAQTPARSAVLDRAEKKSLKSIRKQRNSHSDPPTSDKTQKEINHAQSLYSRVDAIRTGAPKQERQRIRAVERARRIKK